MTNRRLRWGSGWPAAAARLGLFVLLPFALGVWYMTAMPGGSRGEMPLRLSESERMSRARLAHHVSELAGRIGQRNLWVPGSLEAASAYIAGALEQVGYRVQRQSFASQGATATNLEVEVPGMLQPQEIVLVGAHYDSVPGSPGADDNASGVAAGLELAQWLRDRPLGRTVRFVFFANEEPPFFRSGEMGSQAYARRARGRGEDLFAMLSLESIGYYDPAQGSQSYPIALFRLLYPGRGDFVGFVGDLASRGLVRRVVRAFRRAVAFPSEGVAAPRWVAGVGWSDHQSFWDEGYPALMVTDTAPFRNPNYHTAQDLPQTLDYDALARVVTGLAAVVEDLAGPAP